MGDWCQTVCDVEAAEGDGERLAASVVDWLVREGVVLGERTDCVLGADLGHPPGPRYTEVVKDPGSHIADLWTNGLQVATGRQIFDSGQGEVEEIVCPHCRHALAMLDERYEPIDTAWRPFSDAIKRWQDGGDGRLACPACGRDNLLNDWIWNPMWGFGEVCFTFWNWAPLREDFLGELSGRLGHRTVLIEGKL